MKTTLILPDDLMTEVKVLAVAAPRLLCRRRFATIATWVFL